MAMNEQMEKEIDKQTSTQWAIANLASQGVGAVVGMSMAAFDLVNRYTRRAHTLTFFMSGVTLGPLPISASLTSSAYTYFTTRRLVNFRDFNHKGAGMRSISVGFYSYAEIFIKDGSLGDVVGQDLVSAAIDGGLGVSSPGADFQFGSTLLNFGDGHAQGDVNYVLSTAEIKSPEPIDGSYSISSNVEPYSFDLAGDALFDFGKAILKQEAVEVLGYAGKVIRSQRGRVLVEGYTDSIGDDAYNRDLSKRRAAVVAQWLIDADYVKAASVETYGGGIEDPVVDNTDRKDTLANRDRQKRNRRVTCIMMK